MPAIQASNVRRIDDRARRRIISNAACYLGATLVEMKRELRRAPTEVELMRRVRSDGWTGLQAAAFVLLAENTRTFKLERFELDGIRRRRFVLDGKWFHNAKASALSLHEDVFWAAVEEGDHRDAAALAVSWYWMGHARWPQPARLQRHLQDDVFIGGLSADKIDALLTEGLRTESIVLFWDGHAARLRLGRVPRRSA